MKIFFQKFRWLIIVFTLLTVGLFIVNCIQNTVIKNSVIFVLENMKNPLTLCIALIGAYIAFEGLSTWKKEISGRNQYELSKNLAIHLSQLRNSLYAIGNMWYFLPSGFKPISDEQVVSINKWSKEGMAPGPFEIVWHPDYKKKLNQYLDDISKIETIKVEVELLLNRNINNKLSKFINITKDFSYDLEYILQIMSDYRSTVDIENLSMDKSTKRIINYINRKIPTEPEAEDFLIGLFKKHTFKFRKLYKDIVNDLINDYLSQ